MNNETLLFRQVSPAFIKDGRVTSQAFTPTRKDNEKLSVYDGEQFSAEESWKHFATNTNGNSVGVLAVTVNECSSQNLRVVPDNNAFQGHALIDFSSLGKNQTRIKSRILTEDAIRRGWQYKK